MRRGGYICGMYATDGLIVWTDEGMAMDHSISFIELGRAE